MQLEVTRVDDVITIFIEGRVDTNTSPQLQEEILSSFQKSIHVVLDFEKCDYVSSAGLRALLIGHKTATSKRGYMKLVHVPPVLMNILQMSGFEKFLIIE